MILIFLKDHILLQVFRQVTFHSLHQYVLLQRNFLDQLPIFHISSTYHLLVFPERTAQMLQLLFHPLHPKATCHTLHYLWHIILLPHLIQQWVSIILHLKLCLNVQHPINSSQTQILATTQENVQSLDNLIIVQIKTFLLILGSSQTSQVNTLIHHMTT